MRCFWRSTLRHFALCRHHYDQKEQSEKSRLKRRASPLLEFPHGIRLPSARRFGKPAPDSNLRAVNALSGAEWSCVVTQRNSIFHALSPLVCNCPSRTLAGSFTAGALHLVTETLLVPMLPHAFAALVLGDFCFSSFFERAHSDFLIWNRRFNHLIPGIATEFRCNRNHWSACDGFCATTIMLFHRRGNRPAPMNRTTRNPSSFSRCESVLRDQNLMCPPSQNGVRCESHLFVSARTRFFR